MSLYLCVLYNGCWPSWWIFFLFWLWLLRLASWSSLSISIMTLLLVTISFFNRFVFSFSYSFSNAITRFNLWIKTFVWIYWLIYCYNLRLWPCIASFYEAFIFNLMVHHDTIGYQSELLVGVFFGYSMTCLAIVLIVIILVFTLLCLILFVFSMCITTNR